MSLSLNPAHWKRYARLARLLMRYGHSDLVRNAGLEAAIEAEDLSPLPESQAQAERLTADLEELGSVYIKLGQLLSTRVDLLPAPYIAALSRLQDQVEPIPYPEVERLVQEELGVRLSKAFQEFETTPLATASLGQVHRARLRDGRQVAVKVQRPGVRSEALQEMEVLEEMAEFVEQHTEWGSRVAPSELVREMRRTLLQELNYRQEATQQSMLRENLQEFPSLVVPRPVPDYSSSGVLTMEYIQGQKITSISPLGRLEVDGSRLADELFRAYLKQILVDGFFHADPHPGNVFLTEDHCLALLDVGMVGRVTPALRDDLLRLLLATSEGRGEEAADRLVQLGERQPHFDRSAFAREVSELVLQHRDSSVQEMEIGRLMLSLTRSATEHGLRLPSTLAALGKTLLNLDQIGRILDPHFEPNRAVQANASEILQRRMRQGLNPSAMFSRLLEMNEFAQRLPERLNRVLDAVGDRELEVRIRMMNEMVMMRGLQKVANRIAMGLVLASLILGAALLMRIDTRVRILGYPALAMILFLAAALGGLWFLVHVLAEDRRDDSAPH